MDQFETNADQKFTSNIGLPFQLYNSLFTSLPFDTIEKTGILLSLFQESCTDGFNEGLSPVQIVDNYFDKHSIYKNETERLNLLFRFIQYVERQIVLFDALEDAKFRKLNDMDGAGSLKFLVQEARQKKVTPALVEKLNDFAVRIVLTAHPTQFYPGPVLGIIHDLSKALRENDANNVNMYLQQLGKTAFFKKLKPTPYDEAISLVWFLEYVFYTAAGNMVSFLKTTVAGTLMSAHPPIRLGFWPGGDRDGNPNVNVGITLKVAEALRSAIITCYYRDVKKIKRRLTFKGIDSILNELEANLYRNIYAAEKGEDINVALIMDSLTRVKHIIATEHNGLFESRVDELISKLQLFGLYFATLDIRQDSSVHTAIIDEIVASGTLIPTGYATATDSEKTALLTGISNAADTGLFEGYTKDTLETIAAIKTIQQKNGEDGCNRYIISQCNSALNIMEVYGLFLLGGWEKVSLQVDIIPLFENVDALEHAGNIMETVFNNETYRQHLEQRNNVQTIMVGFSDGTKDGGYLMANWGIYRAKKALTELGRKYDIDIVFFDGRGGPPARGGGKTHNFYASMGKEVSNKEIQLTIQGQTISSRFGTVDAARFNMEQLMTAGIRNDLFPAQEMAFSVGEKSLMDKIATLSMEKYLALRNHPKLVDYLVHVSPIKFYGDTNIGSRPSKRNTGADFALKDLRAIPFVGAWSQVKQNVTGYYGVGAALQKIENDGEWEQIVKLYNDSLFFKTLIDNCEMSMEKCFFPLTAVYANDPEFGEIWNDIYNEFVLSREFVLKLSGKPDLLSGFPIEKMSIATRDKIVLPLVTIQQYALTLLGNYREEQTQDSRDIYKKMIIRCSFGIINAGRNSA